MVMPLLSRIRQSSRELPSRSLWQTDRVADNDRHHCPGAHYAEARARNFALDGNVAGIRNELKSGANVNGTNEQGQTASFQSSSAT